MEPSYSSRLQNTPSQYYSNLPHAKTHTHSISNSATLPVGSSLVHSNNTYSNIPSDQNLQYSNVWHETNSRTPLQDHNFHSSNTSLNSTMPRSNLSISSNIPSSNLQSSNLGDSRLSLSSNSNVSHGNVPLSTNLVPKAYAKPDQHVTYSNIQVGQSRNRDGLIYSNLMHPPREPNMYSNLPNPAANVYSNGGKQSI